MGGDSIGDNNLLEQFKKSGIWKEGMPLRLHLGCGEHHLDGYVNIDYPQSRHTVMHPASDFCADIVRLAFAPGTVDEVRLHHVFEHFDRVEALGLLIKWHGWLRTGGTLRIETPDLIGSAKILLSQPSWKTKMGTVRHLSGDHASSWGYHLDHWFAERFEHTLGRLGFDAIEARHTSWPNEPFLANVEITAVKARNIPLDEQQKTAEQLLLDSVVTTSPAAKQIWQVWKERLGRFLRGEIESPASSPVPNDSLRAALARTLAEKGSQLPIDQIIGFNQKARDRWVAQKARVIPPGSRVLDVGAGTCPYRSLFSHCDYRTHDFKKLQEIKLGPVQGYGPIDYVSDVTSIPVPDELFDVVLCTEVFEHTDEPIKALAELARILRPGGELLLTAPLGSGLHQLPFHFYGGFTPQWYKRFLPRFALAVQEIEPNGGFFKMMAQECARVAWTLPQHRALHGENADLIQYLFGEAIPRYLFALDERCFIDQFTVGYHVRAVKVPAPVSTARDVESVSAAGAEFAPTERVTTLIFSKDRAMQLAATIDSFLLHCRDSQAAEMVVLFKASSDLHRQQYDQVRRLYTKVRFVEELDFRQQVPALLAGNKYVLFLVDDNLFTGEFTLGQIVRVLDAHNDAIGFSLRLGRNTTRCYAFACDQKLPDFVELPGGMLKYNWTTAEHDFAYCLEVSSSVYRSAWILELLNDLEFTNPNTLESKMSGNRSMFAAMPALLTCERSVTFCNPVNIVQSAFAKTAKYGASHRYSTEQLAGFFSQGLRIDVERYKGFVSNGTRQEVELHFISQADKAPESRPASPRFSVVTANYNNGRYIAQAIESVLCQTFRDWELIIVDDSSSDDSVDIIKRYLADGRIRLMRHDTNKGYVAALKTGIAAVKSELLGVLDSDDGLSPDALEVMYRCHTENPGCGLIYSQFMYCDEQLAPQKPGYCREVPAGKTNVELDTVSHFKTFKMRDYLKTSGYDQTMLYAEDKDIVYKMEEVTKLKFVDKCLYFYRRLPHSQGHDSQKAAVGRESMARAKSATLARRSQTPCTAEHFLKAQQAFGADSFQLASQLMAEYRGVIDYAKFPRMAAQPAKSEKPDLSVIVVTYNRTAELKKCLESLAGQDDRDFEIVVVDNGGTDYEQIKRLADQYVKCPVNFYLSEGRNVGACCAKGRIIAFLDDDALAGPDFVRSIKAAFQTYDIFGLRGKALPKTNPEANRDAKGYDRGGNPFPTFCDLEGCSAWLRKVYLDMGGMDPLLFGHEGSDLTYRICKKSGELNKVIYWPFTIIYHDNIAGTLQDEKKNRYRLIEQYLRFKHSVRIWVLRDTIEKSYLPSAAQSPARRGTGVAACCADGFDTDSTPVALMVYNRPKHTLEVLKALRQFGIRNIYIFCDAPKTKDDEQNVSLVRRLVHSINWTTPRIVERETNLGLARSIVSAVDHVFERYDKLVLLEDDCVPQQHFFDFMQTCLTQYQDNQKVFGVSGYSVSVPDEILKDYPYDLYFCPRIGSWGWATWKRAWKHYNGDLRSQVSIACEKSIDLAQGGADVPILIEKFLKGQLKDVWTLGWLLSVYANKGVYIYPTRSHVKNIGMDGTGVHCNRTAKYDAPCSETRPSRYPQEVLVDDRLMANFKSYYQANAQQSADAVASLRSAKSRKALKVAYVSTTDNKGGAAKVAWMLKQGLKERGFTTRMFVKDKHSDEGDVQIITSPTLDGGAEYKKRGLLYYDIKSTVLLARNPDFVGSDVVHFHNLHGDYFNPFALSGLSKLRPAVWTLHDMQAITGHCAYAFDCTKWQTGCGNCPDLETYPAICCDQTAEMLQHKARIYQDSDVEIIVPSQWLKDIVDKSILRDKKVHLIYNGIDERIYRPYDKSEIRGQLHIPKDAVVVCFASHKGLLDKRKGGDFVLEAYRYFAGKYPGVYFISIGGVSGQTPGERFVQIPFVTDESMLARIYCAADVAVFPTLADNCPLIVLELMGCGVPVVSFNTGGVPEIIEHGKTGFVAGHKNTTELIQLTERLTGDADLRTQFSRASVERLQQRFTLRRMLDEHTRLYEKLVEQSRQTSAPAVKDTPTVPAAPADSESRYLVSAIISTFNSERFIAGCLEDLEKQTIADKLEIIVVDSGSQQNEEQIVSRFQQKYSNIVYIKTEQREGIYSAWNRAVRLARGEFLTSANTDDRHRPDALELMAKTLLEHPDVALVYGDQIVTDTPNAIFENHHAVETAGRPEFSRERLLFGCCVGSQPMWRKTLHDEFGFFDETLTCAGDWDFWLRAAAKYEFRHIPQALGLYYHNERGIEHGRRIHGLYERYIVGSRYGNPYISVIPVYQHKDSPLVSVIMAAHNAAAYIAGAIESVLVQNYRNFELVVVDDGSTDATADIAAGFKDDKIKIFHRGNGGAASARNFALAKSRGSFIVILDSDDMIAPDFIARHLQQFDKCPQADLVYCDDLLIDAEDKPIRIIERPEYPDGKFLVRDLFRCGFPIVPFRTCIRRSVFDKIGLYEERLAVAEDYDMVRRFVKSGLKISRLPAALYMRRVTADSLSRKFDAEKARCHFDVVKRFTETFSCEELFPDVDWGKMPAEQKPVLARCRAAVVYLSIGQDYARTGGDEYARTAFGLALAELDECLRADPENSSVRQLLGKCESIRIAYLRAAGERGAASAVCV